MNKNENVLTARWLLIVSGSCLLIAAAIQFVSPPRGDLMRFVPHFNVAIAVLNFAIALLLTRKAKSG